jgi:hypothetical protein
MLLYLTEISFMIFDYFSLQNRLIFSLSMSLMDNECQENLFQNNLFQRII